MELGVTERIQAMIRHKSSEVLIRLPNGGIGPTTFSEPLRDITLGLQAVGSQADEAEQRVVVPAIDPDLIGQGGHMPPPPPPPWQPLQPAP